MKLRRLVIEDYKQFVGRVAIDDLAPGLNIFTGPNEVGKSTLVDAVRKVFLERFKSSTLGDIAPWNTPGARPRVEVAYTIDGVDHLLIKHFLRNAHCELRVGEKRLEGDEAEAELARSLGFERAGKGAMRPELGGIPGLLWVQQGTSQSVKDSAQHAATYLRNALGELAGGTLAHGDDVLIKAVRTEMTQLVTEKTRKPAGDYAEAETSLTKARAALEVLLEQERSFNQDVERLGRLQSDIDLENASKPWDALERRAAEAEHKARSLEAAKAEAARATKALEDAERTAKSLNAQEQSAIKSEAEVTTLTKQLAKLQADLDAARLDEASAHAAIDDLQATLGAATEHRTKAEAAEAYTDAVAKLDVAMADRVQCADRVTEAERIADEIRALTVETTRLKVEPADITRLREVEREVAGKRAKCDAALTKLEYRFRPGHSAALGERRLEGQGTVSLDATARLVIPEVGELVIVPGVTDLAKLQAKLAELEDERMRLLQSIGASSLAEGEERQRLFTLRTGELKTKEALLAARAPKGLEHLRTSLAAADSKVGELKRRVPDTPPAAAEVPLADAKAEVEAVLSRFDAARAREGITVNQRALLEGQHRQASESLDTKQQFIQSTEYISQRASDRSALANANADVQARQADVDAATRTLAELKDSVEEGAAPRLRQSAELARNEHQRKNEKAIELRSHLGTVGATGLGEQIGQSRAGIEQLDRRCRELGRRANALVLLHDLLVTERDKLVQQLRAPLTQRIEDYLRRLLPQSRLTVDDELKPEILVRDGGQGEFAALSFGTQEQLGVVARLAYADLLKDAGKPTLLIFDDAVTHSDRERLERVKRALIHAAERHQVLVLSCHPENWNDLGVPLRNVEELRAAAA